MIDWSENVNCKNGGARAARDFRYSSDCNKMCLTVQQLEETLGLK